MDFFWYRRIASQFCVLLSRASMRSLFIGKKVHPRHPELDSGSVPRIYALSTDGQESTPLSLSLPKGLVYTKNIILGLDPLSATNICYVFYFIFF
ncbi:MAG: hypothetical protein J6X67_00745 [Treponema sp.]|nr:hypothetical protein [Treponema sp.]